MVLLLVVFATGLRTRRLAAAPFETHAGPALYHFAVMWMLNYREAPGYVSTNSVVPEENRWRTLLPGEPLWRSSHRACLQVLGRVVTAVAESSWVGRLPP